MTTSGLPAGSSLRTWRATPLALAWILVLSLLVLFAAYQIPSTHRIDVGSGNDEAALEGFSWQEGEGAGSYRWSSDEAHVRFAGAGSRAWQLTLRASGLRPSGLAEVAIYSSGKTIAQQVLGGEMAEYAFTIPREGTDAWGNPQITLSTDTFVSPPDVRQLGVMVDWAELSPAGSGPTVPPLGILAVMLATVAIAYSAARIAVTPRRFATAAAMATTLGWAIVVIRSRLWIAGNLVWVLLAAALLWLVAARCRKARWWEWLLIAALAAASIQFTGRAVEFYRESLPPGDFTIYFQAANNLRTGGELYDYQSARGMPNGPVYKYPPLYAALLAPFTVFDVRTASAIWYGLNLALLALFALMVVRGLRGRPKASPAAGYVIAIAVLVFGPAWESLIRGQMDVIILAACTGALVLLQARKGEAWAGAAIAFAAMLKLYPGLLALYLLLQRRWRALAGFVATFAALIVVSGIVAGWNTLWRYVTEILTVQTAAVPWPENQSFDGFLSRLVIPPEATTWYTTIPFQSWTLVMLYVLDAICLGATVWLLWRHRRDDVVFFRLGYVAAMPLIVMMWPTAWIHYQTLLLLPLAWLIWHQADPEHRSWPVVVALVAAFLLLAIGNEYTALTPAWASGWPRLLQSYKLYGVLILWCLLLQAGAGFRHEVQR